jgi:hypothetical protein
MALSRNPMTLIRNPGTDLGIGKLEVSILETEKNRSSNWIKTSILLIHPYFYSMIPELTFLFLILDRLHFKQFSSNSQGKPKAVLHFIPYFVFVA